MEKYATRNAAQSWSTTLWREEDVRGLAANWLLMVIVGENNACIKKINFAIGIAVHLL